MCRFLTRLVMAVGGFALLAVSITGFVQGCGTKWRVGHLGMPQEVVPGDPINQLIADTGHPQEVLWGITAVAAAFFAWAVAFIWRTMRAIRHSRAAHEAIVKEIRRLTDGR